jgi:hypothetical protein
LGDFPQELIFYVCQTAPTNIFAVNGFRSISRPAENTFLSGVLFRELQNGRLAVYIANSHEPPLATVNETGASWQYLRYRH